jgi:hypothetical protein
MRDRRRIVNRASAVAVLVTAFVAPGAIHGAEGETAKADAARKKPLQRCDQLSDKAEIECLQKARERVVEARNKRESASAQRPDSKGAAAPAAEQKTK